VPCHQVGGSGVNGYEAPIRTQGGGEAATVCLGARTVQADPGGDAGVSGHWGRRPPTAPRGAIKQLSGMGSVSQNPGLSPRHLQHLQRHT
jgi:hypothetical protein